MKKVVYLLGAGFSAPLGIPVMADFLEKAKDQFYGDRKRFQHFGRFLDTLDKPHVANSYYATDVFNIEDILSILDMKGQLEGSRRENEFRKFISDVVQFHTPVVQSNPEPQRWDSLLFWERPWGDYGPFVAALLGYEFKRRQGLKDSPPPKRSDYTCSRAKRHSVSYAVVTLNYDMVLETAGKRLGGTYHLGGAFARTAERSGTPLVKLHGSVDSKDIVPPVWSKSLQVGTIRKAWRFAYDLLKGANEIRIIGYSLPDSDSYVRYLLRAAVIDTPNLKRIDVLCKDNGKKEVEERYRAFVTFRHFSFSPKTTEQYLMGLSSSLQQWPERIGPEELERAHRSVFG